MNSSDPLPSHKKLGRKNHNNDQSRKGYFINSRHKLELIPQVPSTSKGTRHHAGHGRQQLPSSTAFNKHDKAIIGQYKKELRKEHWNNPNPFRAAAPPTVSANSIPMSTIPVPVAAYSTLPISVVPQHSYQSLPGSGAPGSSFNQQSNFINTNGQMSHSDESSSTGKKKRRKLSKFQQAKANFDKKLSENNEKLKTKQIAKQQIEQAKVNRKQKRLERNKIQTQKTAKGQPLMKGRIMNLLSQLEQQQNHQNQNQHGGQMTMQS